MAGTIRRREGPRGVTWQIDYFEPVAVSKTFTDEQEAQQAFEDARKEDGAARLNLDGTVWTLSYIGKKRVRESFKTKKEADQELTARANLINANPKKYFEKAKAYTHTFGDLCKKYEENFTSQVSYRTTKKYYIEGFKRYFGEHTVLANITYLELEKFRNDLKAKPRKARKNKESGPRSIRALNVEIGILGQMFAKAKSWGLIEHNPFHAGESLKLEGENKRTRWLDEKQIARLLLASPPHLQPIIEATVHMGTRAGKETLNLRWKDIDFEKGGIRVTRSKQRNGAVKVDTVPMNPDLEALFRSLKPEKADPEGHVFLYEGEPVKSVVRSFRQACKKADIPYGLRKEGGILFHDLRHTCATHLMARGEPQGHSRTLGTQEPIHNGKVLAHI